MARTPKAAGAKPPRSLLKAEAKEELGEEPELDDVAREADEWAKQFEAKWDMAMGTSDGDDQEAEAPPSKKPRTTVPSSVLSAKGKGRGVPKQPGAPPPKRLISREAPITPGEVGDGKGASVNPEVEVAETNETQIRDEHPEWASRCVIEPGKPGQAQRLTMSMAEVGFGDDDITKWSVWMDRRLCAERPLTAKQSGGKVRFRASAVDFAENKLGVNGIKALCALLEKHCVRAEVLRLTGNGIGNEGLRYIAKYLTSSSQALTLELHLSRNKFDSEGVKWLLGSLSGHPAYPVWNSETHRYVPLWLRVENNKLKGEAGYQALQNACKELRCSVCLGSSMGDTKCGPRQCVNVGCCDELKHNCVAHLCNWEVPASASELPEPAAHARLVFAPAGRGAVKPAPSGVESPLRDEPRIIYEDDDVAVVLKPTGWSCAPNPKVDPRWGQLKPLARRQTVGELMTQTKSPALQAWLLLHFGADPKCEASRDQASDRGLAHRLDVDTSGPVLVGKTTAGFEHARKQIVAGILKDYVVLVHGSFSTDRGECNAAVDMSTYADTKRVRLDPSGQPATTVWEALAEYESSDGKERYTLVQCRMVTLRTHQVRAHMQHLGHPIVGDKLYGTGSMPAGCTRIFLHKFRIGFFNVGKQARIETASLQTVPDLWKLLGRFRKVGGMAMNGCGAPGL